MESFLKTLEEVNSAANGIVWGPYMLLLLVGTGIYLTIRTGFFQLSKFGYVWKHTIGTLFKKQQCDPNESVANVTPFQAVSTALASTVGVGNIAGVATAIVSGGPGAVFWMWFSAFFGMCTKYAEILLAVKYRQVSAIGQHFGGPMYYLEKGLKHGKPLAVLFALFGGLAAFGIGNMTQAREISVAMDSLLGIPAFVTGLILAAITALVIIGGIKRISHVTEILVPFMAIFYLIGGLIIIIANIAKIPACFGLIFSSAFSMEAVGGGILGYMIMRAMRYGFARGVFSNEAGLGSAPIAHAASRTKEPVQQAMWGVFEVFIDTIIICSITAIIVIISGQAGVAVDAEGELLTGGALTALAFSQIGSWGAPFVRIAIFFFALSTILGWSYYGERCWGYLSNNNPVVIWGFKLIFVVFIVFGSMGSLTMMWDIADTLNGMMAIPNLIGLIALSGVVIKTTKEYFANIDKSM
ncbi:MAG: sodium:alanine symporter family protein [Clostridia bacterium]|nr:sodium:alanine symporter family protein [Clostridia bacterium]MDD4798016.1 sodium:alanine symporter family protein [Clostridia bacterium]